MQLGLSSPEPCLEAAFCTENFKVGENSSVFLFHSDWSIWHHVMAIHNCAAAKFFILAADKSISLFAIQNTRGRI